METINDVFYSRKSVDFLRMSEARAFWEAQLSGDAAERVAGKTQIDREEVVWCKAEVCFFGFSFFGVCFWFFGGLVKWTGKGLDL